MKMVDYSDRLSVQPGDMLAFHMSSDLPRYWARIVRLIHGDKTPAVQDSKNRWFPSRWLTNSAEGGTIW